LETMDTGKLLSTILAFAFSEGKGMKRGEIVKYIPTAYGGNEREPRTEKLYFWGKFRVSLGGGMGGNRSGVFSAEAFMRRRENTNRGWYAEVSHALIKTAQKIAGPLA